MYEEKKLTPKEVDILCDYDNATAYNDSVVYQIINRFKDIESIVKNDISMVTTEGCIVGDFALTKLQPEGPFRIDTDEYIPEIKKLSDVVHKYNSYLLLDLVHLGAISSANFSPSGGKGFFWLRY